MVDNEKRGRGRPKKDERKVKSKTVIVRMTGEELEQLDVISKWAKMSRAGTIRALILEAKNYYIRT